MEFCYAMMIGSETWTGVICCSMGITHLFIYWIRLGYVQIHTLGQCLIFSSTSFSGIYFLDWSVGQSVDFALGKGLT